VVGNGGSDSGSGCRFIAELPVRSQVAAERCRGQTARMKPSDLDMRMIRWDVPFADALLPSVALLADPGRLVRVVVSPGGIDHYPKYLVDFDGYVVAFREEDETFAPGFPSELHFDANLGCAWLCLDSPWLKEHEQWGDYFEDFMGGPLRHYLVIGGDSVVEILATRAPSISTIGGPTLLETTYDA
jgi:hypothetical protein